SATARSRSALGLDQEQLADACVEQPSAEGADSGADLDGARPWVPRQLLEHEVAQPPRPREVAQVPEVGVGRCGYASPLTAEPGAVFGGVTVAGVATGPWPLPYGVAGLSSEDDESFLYAARPPPAAIGISSSFLPPL